MPEGSAKAITIGAKHSLWTRRRLRWIDGMTVRMPELSVRAKMDQPDRLARVRIEGVVQAALTYLPQMRPNFRGERLFGKDLVLLAGWLVRRDGVDEEIRVCVQEALAEVVANTTTIEEGVIEDLEDISDEAIELLGGLMVSTRLSPQYPACPF